MMSHKYYTAIWEETLLSKFDQKSGGSSRFSLLKSPASEDCPACCGCCILKTSDKEEKKVRRKNALRFWVQWKKLKINANLSHCKLRSILRVVILPASFTIVDVSRAYSGISLHSFFLSRVGTSLDSNGTRRAGVKIYFNCRENEKRSYKNERKTDLPRSDNLHESRELKFRLVRSMKNLKGIFFPVAEHFGNIRNIVEISLYDFCFTRTSRKNHDVHEH